MRGCMEQRDLSVLRLLWIYYVCLICPSLNFFLFFFYECFFSYFRKKRWEFLYFNLRVFNRLSVSDRILNPSFMFGIFFFFNKNKN